MEEAFKELEKRIEKLENHFQRSPKMVDEVTQVIKGKTLIWGKCAEEKMNWEDAKEWCEAQGEGWRLPTRVELLQAYEDKEVGGIFQSYSYWSATEYSATNAYYVTFGNGYTYYYLKNNSNYVRVVK